MTAEEAAFFVPSAPKFEARYTQDWETNEKIPWLTYLVKSGWYSRDTRGDQVRCGALLVAEVALAHP